ncbi:MAG: hypothetical protein LUH17_00350 [Acidaminococcaceae bacterium]|nr:hypothetical protein [Acidaminococcaceae bacterium]
MRGHWFFYRRGQVLVTSIDGAAVELSGKLPAILTLHKDKRGHFPGQQRFGQCRH